MTAFSSIPGEPNFSGYLNATYVQVYSNGSKISTPCYIDTTQNPIKVTNLTPVDDHLIAGPQTDAYVLYNGNEYRQFQIIGDIEGTQIG